MGLPCCRDPLQGTSGLSTMDLSSVAADVGVTIQLLRLQHYEAALVAVYQVG